MNPNSLFNKVLNYDKFALLFDGNNIFATSGFKKFETAYSIIWLANPNQEKISIDLLERIDNEKLYTYEIDGIWSAVVKDKLTNDIKFMTSAHNEIPWYYSLGQNYIVSTNIFLFADTLKDKSINYDAISSFLAFDFCYGGETFLQNIKKSYGGDIITLKQNNSHLVIKSIDLQEWLGFDESINNRKMVLDSFIDTVEKSTKNENCQITLTAGSDSRAILGAAYYTKHKFTLMTGTASSTDPFDIRIAQKIAKTLNIEHFLVDESKKEVGNFEKAIENVAIQTSAQFIPRNWLIFYKEYLLNSDLLENITRLMGYRGEFFKGFYRNIDKTVSRKTFFLNKLYTDRLKNIVKSRIEFFSNISKQNVNTLLYHRERDNFWVSSNIRAMLQSGCKIRTPFSNNELLKLGYRFVKGIENTEIHNLAINLLPNNIKNLPTSYNKIGYIARHIYKRVWNHNDYNFFLYPTFIRNNLNYEILTEIMDKNTIDLLIKRYSIWGHNDALVHKLFAVSYFFKLFNLK